MRAGSNQYAPMPGLPRLREAIAAKYQHDHGRRYDPETEITITSGGTEAIFDAIAATIGRGDEVIVLEPCYDSYVPAITLSGGAPVFVPLTFPAYAIDWERVRAAITARTVSSARGPGAPRGSVATGSAACGAPPPPQAFRGARGRTAGP